MTLPKSTLPLFELKIPSTGKKILFRPFTVKEQRILLLASESGEKEQATLATKQVVSNCVQEDIDVNNLPMFDLEYIFLNISAKSSGEIVEFLIKCSECEHSHDYSVNILDVEVIVPDSESKNIKLDDNIGIMMKYPNINITDLFKPLEDLIENLDKSDKEKLKEFNKQKIELTNDVIISCIDYVYDLESVFYPKDYSKEELIEYIEGFTDEQLKKINQWFKSIPEVATTAKFTCSKCGHENEYEIKGLKSFL